MLMLPDSIGDWNTNVAPEESMETSDTAQPHSKIETFLDEAIEELRQEETTDVELFEILANHILVESPADTAVANAVKQIETLATERAEGN